MRYTGTQHLIRISHEDILVVADAAEELARATSARLGVEGANITFGRGYWKGNFEHSATIEIVTREMTTNEDMRLIRNHVTAMGLTAFVTVNRTEAHELF